MTFPASLPSFTNPTGTDDLDDLIGGLTHSGHHAALNDAVEEIAGALTVGSLTTTSFTPTFSNVYGTVPTVGTGGSATATGRYVLFGPLFLVSFRIVFGTSGQTAGTGIWTLNPPVTAASGISGHGTGSCAGSAAVTIPLVIEMFDNKINAIHANATNTYVGAGTPAGIGSTAGTAWNGTMLGFRA
jgi:hypothetical protein